MKKLFLILFALSLPGCTYQIILHKQDIMITDFQVLPVRIGLYIPKEIRNDTLNIHDLFHMIDINIKTGTAYSEALESSISTAAREMILLDTFPSQNVMAEKSLRFAVVPTPIHTHLRGWVGSLFRHMSIAAFQSDFVPNIDFEVPAIASIAFPYSQQAFAMRGFFKRDARRLCRGNLASVTCKSRIIYALGTDSYFETL